MASNPALHEVVPREQVGAQTGALYEYQYHQAAAEALSLLTDEAAVCIYCEWHDDYVVENSSAACYAFHQVKTRIKSKGPWRLNEFFGLTRKKAGQPEPPSDPTSIFAHLWDHMTKFGHMCGRFIFVTDAGVESELKEFLSAVHGCSSIEELSGTARIAFDRILAQASQSLAALTNVGLFTFLSKVQIRDAVGTVQDFEAVKAILASRIYDASEVDLLISEARKIGADLVTEVRSRSHRVLDTLPQSTGELQRLKGLIVEDVLKVLSLSVEGYRQLRNEGKETVRTLSRLHRLCRRSNIPEEHIPLMCSCKVAWNSWWMQERDRLDTLDVLALRNDCVDVLRAHVSGAITLPKLIDQANAIAQKYKGRLTSFTPISGDSVFGLFLEIAVDAQDLQ
jgi:hypothetical protein